MGSNLISLRKHIHCRIVIESEAKHAADEKNISKKNHHLLPAVQQSISTEICSHCNHVNKTKYSFCTNCGYPLHDAVLADNYFKLLKEKKQFQMLNLFLMKKHY